MPLWLEILFASSAVLAAGFSAVAAWKAKAISRESLDWAKSTEAPVVVARPMSTPTTGDLIYIQIENIGRSIAYDVAFKIDEPLVRRLGGLTALLGEEPEPLGGCLEHGIPALGPGDSRKILWGKHYEIYKELGDRFIKINASFKDRAKVPHLTTSVVEVKSFVGADAADNSSLSKIARGVERIAQSSEGLVRD